MNGNYLVHHELLEIEPIKSLTGLSKIATWHTMCMIIHFTATTGSCQLPKNQLAKSLGISNRFLGLATKLLIQHNWIKEIKAYDKATQQPAIYTTSIGYSHSGIKLYTPRHQAIVTTSKEKEFKKNSKPTDVLSFLDDNPHLKSTYDNHVKTFGKEQADKSIYKIIKQKEQS